MPNIKARMRAAEKPVVSRKYVIDPKALDHIPGNPVELTPYKGQRLVLKIRGVAQLLAVDEKPVAEMVRLGLIERVDEGKDKFWHLAFDPAHGCLDLWERWIQEQPTPDRLADFDAIRQVRDALRIPSKTPYPKRITDAAFDFLEDRGILNGREARELLPFKIERSDPTQAALTARTRRPSLERGPETLATLVKDLLPPGLRQLPLTALDPRFDDVFPAPPLSALQLLATMRHLRTESTIYIFRLAASGATGRYVHARALNLTSISENLKTEQDDGGNIGLAIDRHLTAFIRSAEQNVPTRNELDAPSTLLMMLQDLRSARQESEAPETLQELEPVVLQDEEGVRAALRKITARMKSVEKASRMARAGPLAERLDEIAATIETRWHDLEILLAKVRSCVSTLDSQPEGCERFTSTSTVENEDGSPQQGTRTDYWEVWEPEAYLSRLARQYTAISRMPSRLRSHQRRNPRADSEPFYLRHVRSECHGKPCEPPLFVTFFSLDLMNGSWHLPIDLRERRFETIVKLDLPGASNSPKGLLDFDDKAKEIHRIGLLHGETLVPVEQFVLAMRMARAAFVCGRDTAMRTGELLQIRGDAANLDFDEKVEMAYWRAYPKGAAPQSEDALEAENGSGAPADPADDGRRRFYLGEYALEALADLQDEVIAKFGEDGALPHIKPPQQLSGKTAAEPFLFRSSERALGSGDLQLFLTYLCAGLAIFGVHDLRAAVAKDLYARGVHPDVIRDLLGHAYQTVTYSYMKLSGPMKQRKKMFRSQAEGVRKSKMLALANALHTKGNL